MRHLHLILAGPVNPDMPRPTGPALATLLARGRRSEPPVPGLHTALCRAFGLADTAGLAPLLLAADGHDPGQDSWLCAEPVHLAIHIDKVVLDPAPLPIDPAEAKALVEDLNAHFALDGLDFLAPTPQRWYLRAEQAAELDTLPTDALAGQAIDGYMPQGPNARLWRARLNEMQMLLHGHPINRAREARGQPPINGLWLWGGGVAKPRPRPAFDAVFAKAPAARVLAQAAGLSCAAPPEDFPALPRDTEQVLLVLDAAATGRELERNWLAPLLEALRWRRLKQLTLEITARPTTRLEVKANDIWKIWRSGQPA